MACLLNVRCQRKLKKVNAWNPLENTRLNAQCKFVAVWSHRGPCIVSQSGCFRLREQFAHDGGLNKLVIFEPNISNNSLTHLPPSPFSNFADFDDCCFLGYYDITQILLAKAIYLLSSFHIIKSEVSTNHQMIQNTSDKYDVPIF